MAGINGNNIGGQQPVRTGHTDPTQQADAAAAKQRGAGAGGESLTVSHTEGHQSGGKKVPVASIPPAQAELANHLASLNPNDLQALLSSLNTEVRQTQDDLAISSAEAQKNEVKETQEKRLSELEQLKNEKAEAEKQIHCANVKTVFAGIFSLGITAATGWHREQGQIKVQAQQTLARIELQEQGVLGIPAPELPAYLQEVAATMERFDSSLIPIPQRNEMAKKITASVLDKKFADNPEFDRATFNEVKALLNSSSSGKEFYQGLLMRASQKGEGAAPAATAAADGGQKTAQELANDDRWLSDMNMVMGQQEEEMNKVIADLEEAQQTVVSAAQSGHDIASLRFRPV